MYLPNFWPPHKPTACHSISGNQGKFLGYPWDILHVTHNPKFGIKKSDLPKKEVYFGTGGVTTYHAGDDQEKQRYLWLMKDQRRSWELHGKVEVDEKDICADSEKRGGDMK